MASNQIVKAGPWGRGGNIWDDCIQNKIKRIIVTVKDGELCTFQGFYDKGEGTVHGEFGDERPTWRTFLEVNLESPKERLERISGYLSNSVKYPAYIIVRSITFHTNYGSYGPFGDEKGVFFTSSKAPGEVIGFFGNAGARLDAIGVHIKYDSPQPCSKNPMAPNNCPYFTPTMKAGSWGGKGGCEWDEGIQNKIKRIILTVKDGELCNFQGIYDNVQGTIHGEFGNTTLEVNFESPKERLERISGYLLRSVKHSDNMIVRSITFHTNFGSYGPFGDEIGEFFTSSKALGEVVGFFGNAGSRLDAIGVHIKYDSPQPGSKNPMAPNNCPFFTPTVKVGPWGARPGPDQWDEGIQNKIKRIVLTVQDGELCNFQGFYNKVQGNVHGEFGKTLAEVSFESPKERLERISGYLLHSVKYSYAIIVRSITFHTNLRSYGPFGDEKGQFFTSPKAPGEIVGFFGRGNAGRLDTIGVYIKYDS